MSIRTRFKKINHLPRHREVVNVLIKHGFVPAINRFSWRRLFKLYDPALDVKQETFPRRLRGALEELGPTYIKLGQLLSTRPDILGPEYIKELEKLQNEVPPFSFAELKKICAEEGIDIDNDYKEFIPEPIAAASMAQVHVAYLHSGDKVVVKVQRPNIDKIIATDLEILKEVSFLLEKRTAWGRFYRVSEIIDEIAEAIKNELDFNKEARNADKFYNMYKKASYVKIPKVYWELSTKRVLTLEYVEGIKVSDFINLKRANYDTEKIASHLVEALFKQIYEYGFFHADPHPGNIAIGANETIIFYDFGQVGTVEDTLKEKGTKLLIGMMRYDANEVTRLLLEIAIGSQNVDKEEFRRDVSRLQQKYYGLPLSEINIGEAISELIEVSMKHKMRLPPELSLLVKMAITLESIVSQLDPNLSIVDIAEPYGKRLVAKKFSPQNIKNVVEEVALNYGETARNLPKHIDAILSLLEEGELKVRTEHSNLNKLSSRLDIMSNRLSLAIIVASLVIGTALVFDKTSSLFLDKIPLVEIGFAAAIILGLFLAYSILKSGRY